MSQYPNEEIARRKSSMRDRCAIFLSRVGWVFASLGLLCLLAAGPTALYAIAGSNAPPWTGTQVAALGVGLCLFGLLLGVVATLMGRSKHL